VTFSPTRRRGAAASLTVAALALTLGVAAGVGADALQPSAALADAPPAADFYNPVLKGADPSIVRDGDVYYSVSSDAEGIWVRKSTSLATMSDGVVQKVWEPDATGPLCCNVWAPEILLIRGEWYIYFAADDGQNANHRMYGIRARTDDPQGEWTTPVKMAAPTDRWAIDATVMEHDGELYFLWSGWEGTVDVGQSLYIAPMSDPLTISGERVQLSTPSEPWERVALPIQEGPEVLEHDGVTTIVYSASGSWTEDYCLGTLTSDGGPVLDPSTWTKSDGCVFSKRDTAWGPGHHTFTTSPDGTEDWIVYHASTVKDRGWDGRTIRAQRFTWGDGGTPEFGVPVATYETVALPSGDRTPAQATYEAEDAKVNRARVVDVSVPGASGHQKVGYIDFADSWVEFTVDVPMAGVYGVDVRYSNGIGSTSTHLLSVNAAAATAVELPSNGWDNWLFTGVDVDLKAGTNTLRLSKGDGYAELDLIRVDARPLADGAKAAPASGVLSSDNGWDTGLRDGDYTIMMDLWWGENASSFRLYENGALISTTRLVPDSPRAQHVAVPVRGRVDGTYTYTGELLNSRGVTKVAPLRVTVSDAAPGRPVLSHDNHDRNGSFVVTADLWWGTNATEYVFFEDGVEVASGDLKAATPKAQRATLKVEGASRGVHRYEVEFRNGAGATRSAPLTVTVTR
jgi:GH43 family beta-xylosidase